MGKMATAADGVDAIELLQQLPRLINGVLSSDSVAQARCTRMFRELSTFSESLKESTPVILKSGALPRFVEFLGKDDNPALQYDAAWFLTNLIAQSSANTKADVDLQAVPVFVKLLTSRDEEVLEQALWALANITGDAGDSGGSTFYRDLIIAAGAVEPILQTVTPHSSVKLLRTAAFALSNLVRGIPKPNIGIVQRVLPVISQLLDINDEEVLDNIFSAIQRITHGGRGIIGDYLQVVITSGICHRLFEKLSDPSITVQVGVVHVIANITAGPRAQTRFITSYPNMLSWFNNLLVTSSSKTVLSKICFAISNMTVDTMAQVHTVMESNIYTHIIPLLSHDDFEVRKEATWAVCNAIVRGAVRDVRSLVQQGCLPPLCDLLARENIDILGLCLSALERILCIGKRDAEQNGNGNRMAALVVQAGGLSKIEEFMAEPGRVGARCTRMLGQDFGMQDEAVEETSCSEGEDGMED